MAGLSVGEPLLIMRTNVYRPILPCKVGLLLQVSQLSLTHRDPRLVVVVMDALTEDVDPEQGIPA